METNYRPVSNLPLLSKLIEKAACDQEVMCVILLDLSAAFDTMDHTLLTRRLRYRYGMDAQVQSWLESYLRDRTQQVSVRNVQSIKAKIKCGVPQGSILGPILYTLYIAPLGDLYRSHDINFICYADDTQAYYSCGLSTATIEYSCPSMCLSVCLCVSVWVCLCTR